MSRAVAAKPPPSEPDPDPDFVLRLRPLPGWPGPLAVRLRRLLKTALRAYGFRCVKAEEVHRGKEGKK